MENPLPPAGFPPVKPSRKISNLLIIIALAILIAGCIHLAHATPQPTPEEIITEQIEIYGADYKILDDEKHAIMKIIFDSEERISEIEKEQIRLHRAAEVLRTFPQSENLPK